MFNKWRSWLILPNALVLTDRGYAVKCPLWLREGTLRRGAEAPYQQPTPGWWSCDRAVLEADLATLPSLVMAAALGRVTPETPGQTNSLAPSRTPRKDNKPQNFEGIFLNMVQGSLCQTRKDAGSFIGLGPSPFF